MRHWHGALLVALIGLGQVGGMVTPAGASFSQTNLVSDIPGLAELTDPNLKNPWGVSFSPTSPFWVSDQGTNLSTLYRVTAGSVSELPLEVAIPTTASGPQGPTGQVNNPTAAFLLNGTPASFIFANLNGTISAWNGSAGTTAQLQATTPGAVYTGLAQGSTAGGPFLYAANGALNRIDVFNGAFTNVTATLFTGKFADPTLPPGLVPFNVQNIGGEIYVTYAPAGRAAQISAPEGAGAVDVFDASGNFIKRLVTGSKLASPWGITMAPASFGAFGGDLLVGNFSYAVSEINAFDPVTGVLLGTLTDAQGHEIINPGLWALKFGNGVSGDANTLFFAAGINSERDGLFGSLAPVPEPTSTFLLLGIGALAVWGLRWRRKHPW